VSIPLKGRKPSDVHGRVGDSFYLDITEVVSRHDGSVNVLRPDGASIYSTSYGPSGVFLRLPT